MNLWQVCNQVRYTLRAATWDGSAKILRSESVFVTGDVTREQIAKVSTPAALLRIQEANADPDFGEEPTVLEQTFDLTIACSIPGDAFGQNAFLGANRTGGQTTSQGRGILEMEEVILAAIGALTDANGVHFLVSGKSAIGGETTEDARYLAWRTYRFTAAVTSLRFYHPPTRLVGTPGAGHTAVLTWRNPVTRYDTRRMVLRRASGSTAPASPTAGTGITLGGSPDGAGVTSKTDTPGAGTWSYALFAMYDETGSGADERWSAARTVTVVVA